MSNAIFFKNNNGLYHRIDGPAIEYPNGYKSWWINGERHREDGPAIDDPIGYKAWYINGKLHRLDGPAIEYPDDTKYWYIKGKCINCSTQEEFLKLMKMKAFW